MVYFIAGDFELRILCHHITENVIVSFQYSVMKCSKLKKRDREKRKERKEKEGNKKRLL